MSSVYFVSDLHLGHRTIMEHTRQTPGAWRGGGRTLAEHDAWVIDRLMSVKPTKRTVWWILGDVAMDPSGLKLLDTVPGRKRLVLGNHDLLPSAFYLESFTGLFGSIKKYGVWLSHVPFPEQELYGLANVHGHLHCNSLRNNPRYVNTCIEWLPDNRPLTLEEVKAYASSQPAAREVYHQLDSHALRVGQAGLQDGT